MAISIEPSSYWDGNDGLWNSFVVSVGTPGQDFRVFPSTAGQETWIPVPQGCTSTDPIDCAYLRGALPFEGTNSTGFNTSDSSTWDSKGIFTLDQQEAKLGYDGNGLFGTDVVAWGGSSNITQKHQTVAGIADKSFFLGLMGLGPKPSNFSGFNDQNPSFLSTLYNHSKIPSLSWAYTAGASYRNHAPASLSLGGYDSNRISGDQLSIPMNGDNSRPLQVGLQKVLASNTLSGTVDLGHTATYHFLDSTLPHIWLPSDTVDAFVSAFGLNYDNETDLFLVNNSVRSTLLNLNPTISFVLGADTLTSDTSTIQLPYAAFDLQASYPFYENATNYFPIRRAANDSQYTIGRTFFQESYITADYLRNNFSIAQANHSKAADINLVTIEKPGANNSTGNGTVTNPPGDKVSSGLSGGAVAGIVIAAIAAVVLIGLAFWLIRRKRRQSHAHSPLNTDEPEKSEEASSQDKKADPQDRVHELSGPEYPELAAPYKSKFVEVDGSSTTELATDSTDKSGSRAELGHGGGNWVSEAPGSPGMRYELPGPDVVMPREPQ